MTRYNDNERERIEARTEPLQLDLGITDGMQVAAESTLRALPTAAVLRGIDNLFDSSAKMPAQKANEKYGLEGEAAFRDDEEVTESMAKARSDDLAFTERAEMIQGLVNQESPFLGRATQFAASMGAGFADPILVAANVGASMALGAGFGAAAASRGLVGNIIRSNPTAGRILHTAYSQAANRSLITTLAREGAENLLGSIAEETFNFVGVGEERLARKITFTESLKNIVIGTVIGTGMGTTLSKGGREAIASSWGRKYGDHAAEFVEAKNAIAVQEVAMGVDGGTLADQIQNIEVFEPKAWHGVEGTAYKDTRATIEQGDLYLSMDDDGVMHNYSSRGEGMVLTANPTHAQNSGSKVRSLDATNLKILKPEDFKNVPVKSDITNTIADSFVDSASDTQLSKMLDAVVDPELAAVGIKDSAPAIKKELKKKLAGLEDIEDVIDVMDELSIIADTKFDMHEVLDGVLTKHGYDGYTFQGKDFAGEAAYDGVYLNKDSTSKLKTKEEFPVRKPDAKEKLDMQLRQEQLLSDYGKQLDEGQKMQQAARDADMVGTKEDPDFVAPEHATASALLGTSDKKEFMQSKFDALKEKIESGESLTEAEKARHKALEHAFADGDNAAVAANEEAFLKAFKNCLLGKE